MKKKMMKKPKRKTVKAAAIAGAIVGIALVSAPTRALAATGVECMEVSGAPTAGSKWYSAGAKLAQEGHLTVAYSAMMRAAQDVSTPVSAAALGCMARIEEKNAAVDLPDHSARVQVLAASTKPGSAERDAVESYAFRAIVRGSNAPGYASAVNQSPAYGAVAKAIAAIRSAPTDAKTVTALRTAIDSIDFARAAPMTRSQLPYLRLSLARALYAQGTPAAMNEYAKLFKIGLPMQDALIESGWTQLRQKNYPKSIGLSVELQTGKLSGFFAPEACSIRAISFLENCRYSETRKALSKFETEYRPLEAWIRSRTGSSLYELAIARSEGAVGAETVPEKIWSVWSGSELFVSTQNAIRSLFREEREAPESIRDSVKDATVRATLLAETKRLAAYRTRAAERIESHLEGLNRSMLSRIAAESERLRFVSIETNQAAGRDLVFRNANPKLAEVEKDVEKSERKARSYKGKLGWGKVAKDDPSTELWIDEIGAYEGATLDRCKAKAKYKEMRASL
jgi:hypothetical protein